jgi:hypothetical protein
VRKLLVVGLLGFVAWLPAAPPAPQSAAIDSRLDAALRDIDAGITADFAKDGVGGLSSTPRMLDHLEVKVLCQPDGGEG